MGLIEPEERLAVARLAGQQDRQGHDRLFVGRCLRDGGAEMIDRLAIAALRHEPHAQAGVGDEIVRVEAKGGFELGDGAGGVSELRQRQAEVRMRGGTPGRRADRVCGRRRRRLGNRLSTRRRVRPPP